MSLAIIYSRAVTGIAAPLVTVEVHLSNGMAGLHIVGLPETAVKESKDRVRSAIINSHFEFPIRHITINLAPADLPKEGGRFDLPIALGILAASGQLPCERLSEYEFVGELALSGELRAVRGALPVVLSAVRAGRRLVVPQQNAAEAALAKTEEVYAAVHLLDVCAHLKEDQRLPVCRVDRVSGRSSVPDLSEVKGQASARRALELAAAGGHSLLFIGPPGTGKTMLASRLPGIMPEIHDEAALEVAAVASISSNGFNPENWKCVPFRAPHHSSSGIALVGGGRPPRPGEISLAHHGVLFLDELPEFNRHVLECLREPMESGAITISRAAFQTVFPARFQFVAAMNPCPCGYAGSKLDQCDCSRDQIKRYLSKLSGPLLDRIDMQVEVARLPSELLTTSNAAPVEESAVVKARVIVVQGRQLARQYKLNAALTAGEVEHFCSQVPAAQRLLLQAMNKFNLSARVYHRLLKLARTIADVSGEVDIQEAHVSEALSYRCLDRMKAVTWR